MNYKQVYLNGISNSNKGNYLRARECFELSLNDPELKTKSLYKLFLIEIKQSNYAKAREILENSLIDSYYFYLASGLLDLSEFNLSKSKNAYLNCLEQCNTQLDGLLGLSKVYFQTGNYKITKQILETLELNVDFNINALFSLTCLYIYLKNYEGAYKYFKKIDKNKLTKLYLKNHYNVIEIYLKYVLKLISKKDIEENNFYMLKRIFDTSDELLLFHIRKHCYDNKDQTMFLADINLEELVDKVKKMIKGINPIHLDISDIYKFRLDTPIGYKNGVLTSDVEISTFIGTNNILTIFPTILSDHFDQEDLVESNELMLKRKCGALK